MKVWERFKSRLIYARSTADDWVREGCVSWLGIVILVLMIVSPHLLKIGALEPRFRWQGMFIEFIGILCVVFGLAKVRREFSLPSISRVLVDYLFRFTVIFKKRPGAIVILQTSAAAVAGVGTVAVHARILGSVEDRLKHLEFVQEGLLIEFDKQTEDFKRELKKLEAHVDEESKARKTGDEAGAQILTRTMTGDVQLELVGLAYVLVGLVLSNISQELVIFAELLKSSLAR